MDWKQISVGIVIGAILGISGTFFKFQGRISKLEGIIESKILPESYLSNKLPSQTIEKTDLQSEQHILLHESFDQQPLLFNFWDLGEKVYKYHRSTDRFQSGSHSLKIDFKKNNTYQFFGAEIKNPSLRNFKKYNTITFSAYGLTSILIKFEDIHSNQIDIGTLVTTRSDEWNKLALSFNPKSSEINFSQIKNIFFFLAPGNAFANGTVYIDDVMITKE